MFRLVGHAEPVEHIGLVGKVGKPFTEFGYISRGWPPRFFGKSSGIFEELPWTVSDFRKKMAGGPEKFLFFDPPPPSANFVKLTCHFSLSTFHFPVSTFHFSLFTFWEFSKILKNYEIQKYFSWRSEYKVTLSSLAFARSSLKRNFWVRKERSIGAAEK